MTPSIIKSISLKKIMLWNHLDRKVGQMNRYLKPTFLGALHREWSKINYLTVKSLIKTLLNMLVEVIKSNGYQFSY